MNYIGGNLHGETVTEDINNLIEKASNTYDGFNRLIKVEKVKGGKRHTVEFTYDGDGLRTSKTVRSSEAGYEPQVTNYLYDRQYVILETDAQDEVITRYIKGVNYIARIDGSSRLSYYLLNGHGDVVQTVSETGQVENQYDYDIFGNPILTVETEYKNAIRYAGEFKDEETGLYYLRARYYDPYIGRFISADSYWGEDINPLSLNRYTYTHNDPIQYIDPSGYYCESADGKYSHRGSCSSSTSKYIPDDVYYGRSSGSSSESSSNSGGSSGSNRSSGSSRSGGSSGGSGGSNSVDEKSYDAYKESGAEGYLTYKEYVDALGGFDLPPELDWDQDGKEDSKEDKDSFDKDDNDIADWLEESSDDDWVFNDTGWEEINSDGTNIWGPTAEAIRILYDGFAGSEMYTDQGIPKYDAFDRLADFMISPPDLEAESADFNLNDIVSPSGDRVGILSANGPSDEYSDVRELGDLTLAEIRELFPNSFPYDANAKGEDQSLLAYVTWMYGTSAYDRLDPIYLTHSSYVRGDLEDLRENGQDLSQLTVAEVDELAFGRAREGLKVNTGLGAFGVLIVSKVFSFTNGAGTKGTGDVANSSIKSVDDIIEGASPGRVTKGKATQYGKPGGYNQAMDDFNNMGVTDVKDIPGGKVGKLPDGRTVNVREKSSDGRPTLEIYDGKN